MMIKSFSEISEGESDLVGGKAYSQALLWQRKFNIPPGLIITVEAFEAFLRAHKLADEVAKLDRDPAVAGRLYREIEHGELPEDLIEQLNQKLHWPLTAGFAVRSSALGEDSAAHSFAGIHRTLLGVSREDLPKAIVTCWASAFAPEAIGYRRERRLSLAQIRIAVLIQPLIAPICSGVAFTIDPVSGKTDEMIINATYGIGELLVGGQIEPDLHRLRKGSPPLLIERRLGMKAEQMIWRNGRLERLPVMPAAREQFALSDEQVLQLGEELQRIEATFGAPQDVEWAHDGNALFILQSRPVTTMARAPERDLEWSRVNFREIAPELPSPFCSGLMAMSEPDFANHYRESGFKIEDLRPVLKIIYGRPYFNLSIFKHTAEVTGMPIDLMLRMFGHGEEFKGQVGYRLNYRVLLANLPLVLRATIRQTRSVPTVLQFVASTEQELAAWAALDVDQMSYKQILAVVDERRPYFCNFLYNAMSIGSVIMGRLILVLGMIADLVPEPENFINTQIATGEKNISAQQGLDLLALGQVARAEERCRNYFTAERDRFDDYATVLAGTQFLTKFQDFLARYGHRGIYETDTAMPRYREDPSYLLFAIRGMVKAQQFTTPEEICAQQEREAAREWQMLVEELRGRSVFAPIKLRFIRRQLRRLKQLFALRERVRSEGVRVIAAGRAFHLKWAARLEREGHIKSRADYFMLELQEWMDAARNGDFRALQPIIEQRKALYAFYEKLELPNLLRESEIATVTTRVRYTAQADGVRFQGLAVSPGAIEAEAVVIKSPMEFGKMKQGRILVAPATDPAWMPLFTLAAGVIVEMGGMLSHGSIVAREYGLPTVVNIPGITKRLHDGDRVLLDGTTGVVELVTPIKTTEDTEITERI